jgi:integrase
LVWLAPQAARLRLAHERTLCTVRCPAGTPAWTKTDVPLMIPIHPALQRALDAYPAKGFALIGKMNGAPFTGQALSDLIERAAQAAGLPVGKSVPKGKRCVAHGLRKAFQRKLAEAVATTKQMQAISGHKTLKESERYSRYANQIRLAHKAMALIEE